LFTQKRKSWLQLQPRSNLLQRRKSPPKRCPLSPNLKLRKKPKKGSEENPAYFEKFLYSVGIFTGGLFLFTWLLLIALYRKIGASNVENANLLNDMFKLIKVLHLLNRGQIIKMENGKLLIYDRKNERWREIYDRKNERWREVD